MKISDMICVAGKSAFFFDDQKAIKEGAERDGFIYKGPPRTEGFTAIRQAGESISILLILEDGSVAAGDCAAVQYSGAGGRDPLFLAAAFVPLLRDTVAPALIGRSLDAFRPLAAKLDDLRVQGKRLHTALRYGLSQALLEAVALAHRSTKTQVLCREYALPLIAEPVPIFGQSGDDRFEAADKMILKQADVLPHALMNHIDTKIGRDGGKLLDYVSWLANRIVRLRTDPSYCPDIHIDVYGNLGPIFDHDPERIAGFLEMLGDAAGRFPLWIEGPVDMGGKGPQIQMLAEIKDALAARGSKVRIVADEWCNTYEDVVEFTDRRCCDMVQIKTPDLGSVHHIVESIVYCRKHGVGAYQGGTCNETDVSSRCCVHLALAARADRILAKPGMGFDEGYSIVFNEMQRTLAMLQRTIQPANRI